MVTYRTRTSFVIFTLVALIAILMGIFKQVSVTLGSQRESPPPTQEQLRDVDYWQQRIRQEGPDQAYDAHVRAVREGDIQSSHTLAHVFGSALYKEIGVDAVAVCDDTFAYGCLHEVFERVVDDHGTDGLRSSVERCGEDEVRWHPCHHALGHGLVAYFGYDVTAVRDALDICHDGFDEDPINGCVGGVFMEFNLYTTEGPQIEPRPVDEAGWYFPCTEVDDTYRRACYFWLPQWWREILRVEIADSEELFRVMGEKCRAAPDQRYVRECFERVGQHATYQSKYDPPLAKRLCDAATQDPTFNFLCRSYSAFSFRYTDEQYAAQALEMCVEFSGDARSFCEAFARKQANIGSSPELPHEYRDEVQ